MDERRTCGGLSEGEKKYMHVGISQRVKQLGDTHNKKERERGKRERHLPTSWNKGTTRILVALEEQGGKRKEHESNKRKT